MPVKKSHYTRTQNPFKQYIDTPNKETQSWLYMKYREWLADNHPEAQPVKDSYYLNIYNTKYNLEIRQPKVDTCDTCHRFDQSIKKGKAEMKDTSQLEQEWEEHKEKANDAYTNLREAKN